mmetsp:Transcript_3543/g.9012  ORF Transcript_3543/g.9012 Transcript_3543/m.9012 type:complete len:663 (-) Transcript_3543:256-2244(-)
MQDAANQRDGIASGSAAAPTTPVAEPPSANDKGKEPMTAAEAPAPAHGDGHAEGDEGEEEDEEDDSEKTDMELAWENLETAKLIYNNHMEGLSEEQRLSLAEVHERLADLSMEKEDYETCMTDFKQALRMFQELLQPSDRRLASLHFKMALALQFMDEPEDGLTHCQEALKLMESKLEELKNLVPEGDLAQPPETEAAAPAQDILGVLDDLRDKEVELKEVIAQNATTKELIKNAFTQFGGLSGGLGGDAPAANVVDLGVVGGTSGRSRATPAPAAPAPASNGSAPLGAEDAPKQEKRKRTLEDLMAAKEARHRVLAKLYSLMQSMENKLGGGEGVEGLYGSITSAGTQAVLDAMALHGCLCDDSVLLDVGAGLGRPLLHARISHDVAHAYGIELDRVKCDKAAAFGARTLEELACTVEGISGAAISGLARLGQPPAVLCAPIEAVPSLEPATHAYSFWEGVCVPARAAFGRLFASSATLGCVTVVQRTLRGAQSPADFMADLEFGPLRLVATTSVAMSGSGRKFTAYTFLKDGWRPPCRHPGWALSHADILPVASTPSAHPSARTAEARHAEGDEPADEATSAAADLSAEPGPLQPKRDVKPAPTQRQPNLLSVFRQVKGRGSLRPGKGHEGPGDGPTDKAVTAPEGRRVSTRTRKPVSRG